jgi:hypothetical protein
LPCCSHSPKSRRRWTGVPAHDAAAALSQPGSGLIKQHRPIPGGLPLALWHADQVKALVEGIRQQQRLDNHLRQKQGGRRKQACRDERQSRLPCMHLLCTLLCLPGDTGAHVLLSIHHPPSLHCTRPHRCHARAAPQTTPPPHLCYVCTGHGAWAPAVHELVVLPHQQLPPPPWVVCQPSRVHDRVRHACRQSVHGRVQCGQTVACCLLQFSAAHLIRHTLRQHTFTTGLKWPDMLLSENQRH